LKEIKIFSGSSHPELTDRICKRLGVLPGSLKTEGFSNKCIEVYLEENVRDKIVTLVQTSSSDNLFRDLKELSLMIKTVLAFGAKEVIVMMPYISYSRSDKEHRDGMIIAGKDLVRDLERDGMSRFIGIDFHSKEFEKFFSKKTKVYHLSASSLIIKALKEKDFRSTILLAPDKGAKENTKLLAKELGTSFGWVKKKRISDTKVKIERIYGDFVGKHVIIIDDEISTGTTIKTLAEKLKKRGAKSLTIIVTHGLFVGKAVKNFQDIKILKEIIVTDTVPIRKEAKESLPLRILPVDKLLADNIREIYKS
jgi:ribose-phosphate pyrophosphokinase